MVDEYSLRYAIRSVPTYLQVVPVCSTQLLDIWLVVLCQQQEL